MEEGGGEVEMKDVSGTGTGSGVASRTGSVAPSSVGGGGGVGRALTRTEVDAIPIMSPLEEAIVDCDKKIREFQLHPFLLSRVLMS